MRDEFNRASYDVHTRQSKAKVARVTTEIGGGSVWSFLQDHVDSMGDQLQLAQGAATTQSKNEEQRLFDEAPAKCDTFSLTEKLSEIENSWNVVILLGAMAFLAAAICLCAEVTGIAAKAIGGFIVVMGFVCVCMPGVAGIMFVEALKVCHEDGNPEFQSYEGVAICYKHGKGILTIGVAMMDWVMGLLLVKAGIAKGQAFQQTPNSPAAEQVS